MTLRPKRRHLLLGAPLLLGLLVLACRKSEPPPAPREPAAPPELRVSRGRADLLFSYVGADGKYHDVKSVDEVPEKERREVLVRDLSKKPEELRADEYLYVADLSRERDGGFECAVVSRYAFDRAARGRADDSPVTDGDGGFEGRSGVILYSTSWCGACAATRGYLKTRGQSFLDKDIEKDPAAQEELLRKAKKAGVEVRGVPVIDVHGTLVLGFDRAQLERLLK